MNGLNGFKQCDSLLYAEHNELSDNNYSTIYNNYECIESVQHNQHSQHLQTQSQSQHLAFDWLDNKDQQFNPLLDHNFVQTNNCLNLLDTNQLISEQSIHNFALNDSCVDDNSVLSAHNNNNNNKHLNKIRGTTKKSSRKESCSRQTKPVSAYALFFRDAQSVIKSSNPNASFGEISKVVASNWETLDKSSKNIYKQRADQEKKNYLKSLASSRAKQIAGLMDQSSKQYATLPKDSNQTDANSNNESEYSTHTANFGQQMLQQHQQSGNLLNIANVNPNVNPNANPNASGECGAGVAVAQNLDANKQTCIRDGCSNDAIDSSEWDSEYCSSECCVKHCSDVFQAWVEKQQLSQTNNT